MRSNSCHTNDSGSLKTEEIRPVKKDRTENKYLTIEDLSLLLQVPKSWLYERTRRNQIPFKKLGKYLRFDQTEIENWINKNRSTLNNSEKRRL